ncbi:MAG TPA: DUF362 domain-containing protein [Polyangiaceae bacterium]|nr:DUF362 domain-containing protein [Polyangiaceae bacterium]
MDSTRNPGAEEMERSVEQRAAVKGCAEAKEQSGGRTQLTRRQFAVASSAVGLAATSGTLADAAHGADDPANAVANLIAKPPAGFQPMVAPGKITKVEAKSDFKSIMQPNLLWPQADIAEKLLERAMMEFTGAPNLTEAMKKFIHKDDIVAIKPNGIAGQKGATMAVNFELILPVVKAVLAVGVPAENITVYEQYPGFLMGTRVNVRDWKLPEGVKTGTHNNNNHPMKPVQIFNGISTRYCRFFTEATAVIDMTQIKDHSICGYTGTLKNITHGNVDNPHAHHAHQASPQIAMLYNHPIVTSRVRLHITDAFKVMYDRGPLDKDPRTRIPHGAVYVATDPVAMDTMGWKIVDDERKKRNIPSLKDSRREPRYVRNAGEFGLGVHDLNKIQMKSFTI